MSVQRSPPQKGKKNISERTNVLQYEPEQDLEEIEHDNMSLRTKKRRALKTPPETKNTKNANATSMGDVMQQMRTLFSSLEAEQHLRFRELQTALEKQSEEIKESISFLSERYDLALNRIESLQNERKEDKKRIIALEERVNYLEGKTCSTTIEIRNVPKLISDQNKFEGKEDLSKFISNLGKIVDAEIKDTDIKDIFRIKPHEKSNGTGTIITEFSSVLMKEKVLTATKKFNKGKELNDKLHTEHLCFKGERKPIFVSECVTKKTAKLFSQAREFAKTKSYACWIFRGTVFLRLNDNRRVQIKSEHDLTSIQNKP